MDITGIIIGLGSFIIIGIFHPIVIKSEYYFGKKIWPLCLVCGIVLCAGSIIFSGSIIISALLAIAGFSCFWSIKELFEQEKRVQKGWFPANPKRTVKV
jgi:hypothetical protein